MLHTIFIKCKVDVMYFIFIFISPFVPRFSVKKSVNQLIKNKRPNYCFFPYRQAMFILPHIGGKMNFITSKDLTDTEKRGMVEYPCLLHNLCC